MPTTRQLSRKTELRTENVDSLSQFFRAAEQGPVAVRQLLESGCPLHKASLYWSITNRQHRVTKYLFSNHLAQFEPHHLTQALSAAIEQGRLSEASKLIVAGADTNARVGLQRTPMLVLAAQKGLDELVTALIKNRANVEAQDVSLVSKVCGLGAGRTALMYAASLGHTSTVKTLLAFGADTNTQGEGGVTALDLASRKKGRDEICRLLRKAGGLLRVEMDASGNQRAARNESNSAEIPRVAALTGGGISSVQKAKTANSNYGVSNSALVTFLRRLNRQCPVIIESCGPGFVKARFAEPPTQLKSLARELFKFCPFVSAGHGDTLIGFTKHLRKTSSFQIWWD